MPGKRHELGLEAVIVARRDGFDPVDVFGQTADRPCALIERIAPERGIAQESGGFSHLVEQAVDARRSREVWPGPGAVEVTPRRKLDASLPEAVDRPVVVGPPGPAPENAPDAFRRIGKLLLQPAIEDAGEQSRGLCFGQDAEQRVDAGLDGPLAEQVRAEAVDRRDVRLLELPQSGIESGTGGTRGRATSDCRRRSPRTRNRGPRPSNLGLTSSQSRAPRRTTL